MGTTIEEGYWVRQSVKVKISKEDKKDIGTKTMPDPEIDIVALSVSKNELLLIEVKSYLDSPGVKFTGSSPYFTDTLEKSYSTSAGVHGKLFDANWPKTHCPEKN